MSIERAREYLKNFNLDKNILEFDQSSATVELAAKALNTEPDKIAKSLTFLIDNSPIMIIVSGETKVDNKKYKQIFHTKAKMIPRDKVEELTGHGVGGVCPFGVNKEVKIYFDNSLKKHPYVYPAAGSSNSAIKLTPEEMDKIVTPVDWIDIGK